MSDDRGDADAAEPADGGEPADELPADLDVSGFVGAYVLPDVRRRWIAGVLYLLVAAAALGVWAATRGDEPVLVNTGMVWAAAALVALGAYQLVTAWPLAVRETDALVAATRDVGFPVGHASAQLGWRGLRSRPTWRILLYSAEDPPAKRGMVVVDGVDGEVLGRIVEANPEDWSEFRRT